MSTQQTAALALKLERTVRADRDQAFAAWTQPELLKVWSAPEGMSIPEGEQELRVGGPWRVVMEEPDGTRHEAFGRYREITPPERLVYIHAWRLAGSDGAESTPETVVTVELHPVPGGTRVVLTQEGFATPQSRDGHRGGWASALNRLGRMFAEAP
jgi:uncharacterized protein YndB with AHSA1/START domain